MTSETNARPIDADGHVFEAESKLTSYLESPYLERAQDSASPFPLVPLDGWDRYLGRKLFNGVGDNLEEWLEVLEQGGLDQAVVYPTMLLLGGLVRDPDWGVALGRAYNEWLSADICRPSNGRISGMAYLPSQDADAAAEELRRAVTELGLTGGMLPADGGHLLGRAGYHKVYEVAAELDVAIGVHAAGTHIAGHVVEPFPKFIQAHTFSHPAGVMRQFISMMFEGVFELFPTVRFGFLETGVTWVPWMLDRMDEEFEKRGGEEAPRLTKAPSEYVGPDANIFFGLEAEERQLPPTLDLLGDVAMYASDWPHWDGDYPHSLHELAGRPDLSDARKQELLRGTAERFYGLADTSGDR